MDSTEGVSSILHPHQKPTFHQINSVQQDFFTILAIGPRLTYPFPHLKRLWLISNIWQYNSSRPSISKRSAVENRYFCMLYLQDESSLIYPPLQIAAFHKEYPNHISAVPDTHP